MYRIFVYEDGEVSGRRGTRMTEEVYDWIGGLLMRGFEVVFRDGDADDFKMVLARFW